MAIQLGDIKLVKSTVMDDVPEGGQGPTSHVIEDNKSNEIFKDISEADRARGRLNMSKVFVSVQSDDTDTYLGSNIIVARPPEDPNVSITLFSTGQVYDTREQAKSRMEAYLNKSSEWAGYLLENHVAGQRSVQLFQRPGSELPIAGKTLALVLNEGLSNEKEQYVRATRVSVVTRQYTDSQNADFTADVVTMELSDVLRSDFKGSPPSRTFRREDAATRVRDTMVVDAGMYAGVTTLVEPIPLGAFSLHAASVYTPLVPSAQVETPIPLSPTYARAGIPKEGAQAVTYTTYQVWTPSNAMVLPGGCTPGSLTITSGGGVVVDQGGKLMVGDLQVGVIDYQNGILSLATGDFLGAKTTTYTPAAFVPAMPQSMDIRVTAESRALNYVGIVNPIAKPGTLTISYQVQGSWYVLADDGSGRLSGYDLSFGAGTYNPRTGDYLVTLGALPDVGSSVILQWGVPTQETEHPAVDFNATQTVQLDTSATEMVDPSFFQATWSVDGAAKTATTATDGTISGDATGYMDVRNAQVSISPKVLPPPGTEITYQYDAGTKNETSLAHPSRTISGTLLVSAGATNLARGSVSVEWNTLTDLAVLGTYTTAQIEAMGIGVQIPRDPTQYAYDDGLGEMRLGFNVIDGRPGVRVGTVDYVTGMIEFTPDLSIRIPSPVYNASIVSNSGDTMETAMWRLNYSRLNYVEAPTVYPNDDSGYVKIRYYTTLSATRKTKTEVFRPSFELTPGLAAPATPGSLVLVPTTGVPWGDSGTGLLREPDGSSWINRGTIDYANGTATLTSWPVGAGQKLRRASYTTSMGGNVSSAFVFRTAAAPLRPGSLSIQYAAAGGTQVVTAATNGVISAPGVVGTVDYQTGVVRLGFGVMVVAAGNESEPWYDISRVGVDGRIFKPNPVLAKTLQYTAVAFNYMPLDAEIVGVDPVRLPSDGRVPIFRAGSMVIIGNTKKSNPLTPSNGQTINLARTRLSRALVRDAAGKAVYTGYSADLEAGTVTFDNVALMASPVTIEDRIEDMVVARDVELSGVMSFIRQISHEYPVEDTYVSSALEFGDRKARVSVVFDQATWDGITWSDAPTSAVATASYNTTLAPIEVTNFGASTERFALQFTSPTAFRVVGEHVGVIATGDINTDCAPINPATGHPYLTVRALGWGVGWAVGNIVRINTVGALIPVWTVRTTQPSIEAGVDYSFDLLTRGDVDRP